MEIDLIEAIRRQFGQAKREVQSLRMLLRDRKYDLDQPRVPGGEAEGGQWTSDGGEGTSGDRE
jgi:hypothetical protein